MVRIIYNNNEGRKIFKDRFLGTMIGGFNPGESDFELHLVWIRDLSGTEVYEEQQAKEQGGSLAIERS